MIVLCINSVNIENDKEHYIMEESFSKGKRYKVVLIQDNIYYYAVNNFRLLHLIADNNKLYEDKWFSKHFRVVLQ